MKFKLGDKTDKVGSGDLVTTCVFMAQLDYGKMLFYDLTFKCFRLVYWEEQEDGKCILNGWRSADDPSLLLKL